jgi:hypothetical protein
MVLDLVILNLLVDPFRGVDVERQPIPRKGMIALTLQSDKNIYLLQRQRDLISKN